MIIKHQSHKFNHFNILLLTLSLIVAVCITIFVSSPNIAEALDEQEFGNISVSFSGSDSGSEKEGYKSSEWADNPPFPPTNAFAESTNLINKDNVGLGAGSEVFSWYNNDNPYSRIKDLSSHEIVKVYCLQGFSIGSSYDYSEANTHILIFEFIDSAGKFFLVQYTVDVEDDFDNPFSWKINKKTVSDSLTSPTELSISEDYTFDINGINYALIHGKVYDSDNYCLPVAGALVQYCRITPWGYVPILGMLTFTDLWGNFSFGRIDYETMLPGIIMVSKDGYQLAESRPIYYVQSETEEVNRYIGMTPEQPQPPVPPEPPYPPYPPGPVPPEPVPPTPINPDAPGGEIAQTSDATPVCSLVCISIVAALSCGLLLRKKYH